MSGPRMWPAPWEDRYAAREVEAIVAALREHGPMGVGELRRAVDARLWGPGRFGAALRRARREGRIRPAGRRRVEATG